MQLASMAREKITCECLKLGQLHFLNIVLMEGGGGRDNRDQVDCPLRKENLDISLTQTLLSQARLWS